MEFSTSDYSFVIDKTPDESWAQFHIRAQFICATLEKHPMFVNELSALVRTSQYSTPKRYMRCSLTPHINDCLKKYFGV